MDPGCAQRIGYLTAVLAMGGEEHVKMAYKSSPAVMFGLLTFLFLLIGSLLSLVYFFEVILYEDTPVIYLVFFIICAVIGAAMVYLAYYITYRRLYVKIEVTDKAVKFFMGKRECIIFPFENYTFTSYVCKLRINYIPVRIARYLRITCKLDGKTKDYLCHSFKREIFAELVSYVKSVELIAAKRERCEAEYSQIDWLMNEPFRFSINKQELVKRYKKPFLTGIFVICVSLLVLLIRLSIEVEGQYNLFLGTLSMFAAVSLVILPYKVIKYGMGLYSVKKHTMEALMLFSDRLVLDDKTFYFSRIKQIRVTPPIYNEILMYNKEKSVVKLNEERKMIIIDKDASYTFIIDNVKDPNHSFAKKAKPEVFDDYEEFCDMLRDVLGSEPGKLIWELR